MNQNLQRAARLSVAPMMDWTDRHCRYLHRLITSEALLYTEMITSAALVRGKRQELLRFDPAEQPVALQLGGSDPAELAEAAKIGAAAGYSEINLNVGCPSDRVQSGCFGAVLMENPDLVADCLATMRNASPVEVTVKCRIGVDDQVPEEVLPEFVAKTQDAGIKRIAIHARKAWLDGLSPKENREIPPLDYPLVIAMKREFPELHVSVNGGITSLDQAAALLAEGLDGVMIGRAAYHNPSELLLDADQRIFGAQAPSKTAEDVVRAMNPYVEAHLGEGGRLHSVTRHMLGLFTGRPGARQWRRILSENAHRRDAGAEVIEAALAAVTGAADRAA